MRIEQIKTELLEIAKTKKTPCYIFDKYEAKKSINLFVSAFKKYNINFNVFYAIKSNPYTGLLDTLVEEDCFLDISSVKEYRLAIKSKSKKLVYTGPGKSEEDMEEILDYSGELFINLDSFTELERLDNISQKKGKISKCGVRVCGNIHDEWTKFGIPLNRLREFYDKAKKLKNINLCGIHSHKSFNITPEPYINIMCQLADYLKENFNQDELKEFIYFDIGGGIVPETKRGLYPWNPEQLDFYFENKKELLNKILNDKFNPRFIEKESTPIDTFAKEISASYKENILPILPNATLFLEPGRVISHSVMHLMFKVLDIKDNSSIIVDGGNNMIGYERFQYFEYASIYNLTNSNFKKEIPVIIFGSLCTPEDIWGYYLYCEKIELGDILILPYQGDYTYTLAQNFIRAVPEVYDL